MDLKYLMSTQESTPPPSSSAGSRTSRLKGKDLDDDTKAALKDMSSCKDMDYHERKRQYAALGRAVRSYNCPQLSAKYKMCSDSERFPECM